MSQALIEEITNLEQRELALLGERGRYVEGTEEWRRTNDELNQITNRLSQLRVDLQAEQQVTAAMEQKIEDKVNEEITFNVPGVDFSQLPAEVVTLANIIVRADRRRIYAEEKDEIDNIRAGHKEELRAAEERELQLQRQNDEMQQKCSDSAQLLNQALDKNRELTDFHNQALLDRNDFATKLKNATDQLDEAHAEIKRFNSEMADMRAAKLFGESQSQKVIDITPEDAQSVNVQDLVNTIQKRYVKAEDWGSVIKVTAEDGSFELKKRDEVEKLKETGALPLPELPFQIPDPAAQPQDAQLLPTETPQGGIDHSFRSEDVPTGTPSDIPDMVESSTAEADRGLGGPVSREEYESFRRSTLRHIWEIRGSLESRGMLESRPKQPADSGVDQQGEVA